MLEWNNISNDSIFKKRSEQTHRKTISHKLSISLFGKIKMEKKYKKKIGKLFPPSQSPRSPNGPFLYGINHEEIKIQCERRPKS